MKRPSNSGPPDTSTQMELDHYQDERSYHENMRQSNSDIQFSSSFSQPKARYDPNHPMSLYDTPTISKCDHHPDRKFPIITAREKENIACDIVHCGGYVIFYKWNDYFY